MPADADTPSRPSGRTCALVGNPNCGKTTLFNALTGLRHRVGNYPGVTVEHREGTCTTPHGRRIRIIDLPGSYSLHAHSPDEAVMRDVLLGRMKGMPRPDCIVCVLDASNLERNLYLATQILELGLPVILVLNMTDLAERRGYRIDCEALGSLLGCPVIPGQANSGKGLVELKFALSREDMTPPRPARLPLPSDLEERIREGCNELADTGILGPAPPGESIAPLLHLICQKEPGHLGIPEDHWESILSIRKSLDEAHPDWEERLVAARYQWIRERCRPFVRRVDTPQATTTDRIDAFLLHPLWGWVTVLALLSLLFFLVFRIAEGPMDWITSGIDTLSAAIESGMAEGDLRSLLVDGMIAGVGNILVFLPQILILFLFIGLMEDTGYMARLAFIMDRLMGRVGLNGKSFLPFLSSYACAVPGVMATRTIDHPGQRLVTILVLPLASCSARLPVYLILISVMFPADQVPAGLKAGLMILMYGLGTLAAFLLAWLFNRALVRGAGSSMILELPAYRVPSPKGILLYLWQRSWVFIRRAGTIILGISVLLWAAQAYPRSDSPDSAEQLERSLAGRVGKAIEPLIAPLGYDWKMGIGLVASFAAREVFVSTMAIIYSAEEDDEDSRDLRKRMQAETRPDGTPRYSPLTCLSLMVFYIFAMQCMSTLAVVRRETNTWKWPLFQFAYMTAAAWLSALVVYQGGRLLGF